MALPTNIEKVLWITLSNIGDVILTTPVLSWIFEKFPKAHIYVVVDAKTKGIFEHDNKIHKVYIYQKKASIKEKWQWMQDLRREKFDLIIDQRRSLWPWVLGGRYTNSLPWKLPSKNKHAVIRHLEVLSKWEIPHEIQFYFPIGTLDEKHLNSIRKFCEYQPASLIGLAIGAADPLKRWSELKYQALADKIRHDFQCKFILLGSINDQNIPWPDSLDVLDLRGQTSIKELGAVIRSLDILITNDSGPMHLASALQCPVLAIFGPTDEHIYGPFAQDQNIVRLNLPCAPCMSGVCLIKTHDCMKDLSVEKVYQKFCNIFTR